MAKISANGATEVARVTTRNRHGYRYIWVMTSDGRVLQRCTDQQIGSGYTVLRRRIQPGDRSEVFLRTLAQRHGHTIEETR